MEVSPSLPIVVYDDGSQSPEKLEELNKLSGIVKIERGEHLGLVRTWVKAFQDLRKMGLSKDDGVVLLEDDLLFAKGWDEVLLRMASGTADVGLSPGAMTCFRCHEHPQSGSFDLRGVEAYQSMQHGFQLNMVPASVFEQVEFFEEAARNSEAGRHGIDVWFIGGLSHRLGLTSMVSRDSMVAHIGAGNSIAGKQGFESFTGMGYNIPVDLLRKAASVISVFGEHP